MVGTAYEISAFDLAFVLWFGRSPCIHITYKFSTHRCFRLYEVTTLKVTWSIIKKMGLWKIYFKPVRTQVPHLAASRVTQWRTSVFYVFQAHNAGKVCNERYFKYLDGWMWRQKEAYYHGLQHDKKLYFLKERTPLGETLLFLQRH